jgi:hypothetical protein
MTETTIKPWLGSAMTTSCAGVQIIRNDPDTGHPSVALLRDDGSVSLTLYFDGSEIVLKMERS